MLDEQLDVGEFEAYDVGHDEDGILSTAICCGGDVCADCVCELAAVMRRG